MPASATFSATQKASTFIPILNEIANAVLTMAAVQTANFSAAQGYIYPLGVTGLTVLCPATPAVGDRFRLITEESSVLSVTLSRNGSNIDSAAANLTITGTDAGRLNAEVIYVSAAVGWRVIVNYPPVDVFEVKTGLFTAVARGTYAITASTFTVTLPASPTAGDWVRLIAADATVTAITLGRNSSKINSAAADYVINAKQWECLAYYVDATVGWALIFSGSMEPLARFDAAERALRYHDSQRELSASVGWMPYVYPIGATTTHTTDTAHTLAANGGSLAVPIAIAGHMLLESLSFRQGSTATARTGEWRLYRQKLNNGNSAENTLDEVAGASGSISFTPSAASTQTSSLTSAPVYLAPGLYWLVIRNTNAGQTLVVGANVVGSLGLNLVQTKTLGSALGSTLDFVAATWTKSPSLPCLRLNGRAFGQTAAF